VKENTIVRSNEAMWWSLFSAGGTVAAFLFPAMMIVTGLAVPLGWIAAEDLYALVRRPLTRLFLFVVIALPLFHGAHRIRHTVADLNLKHLDRRLAVVCYGTAIVGTAAAAIVLI
jgi:fumarate reductase subunit D